LARHELIENVGELEALRRDSAKRSALVI